jgi:hypothetical protein
MSPYEIGTNDAAISLVRFMQSLRSKMQINYFILYAERGNQDVL